MTLAELDDRCVSALGQERGTRLALSLFSGAGGLDLGLEAAGWRILAQIEADADCAGSLLTQNGNRGDRSLVYDQRIEDVAAGVLRRRLGLAPGELDLIVGGPPCQPFTTSGLRRALSDARATSLFPAYLQFVREFQPSALLIENVDGMLSAALRHRPLAERTREHPPLTLDERKGSFLRWLVGELAALGYSVSWGVVEAADYGVPQLRQRAVLIGVLGQEPCYLPPPAFGRDDLPAYVTLRQALQGVHGPGPVQPLSARKRDVYRLIPEGGNWRDLPTDVQRETMGAAFHAEGGKSGWWRRLSWQAPSPTILGMPDHSSTALVHPDELRCLSVNECAAIQTFPSWTRFSGSARSQYQQIGNAVPPLLAEHLGRHLSRFLDGVRMSPPPPPPWRQVSANRRIGTHGWATPAPAGMSVALNGAVRADHVWHFGQDVVHDAGRGRRRRQRPAA